MQGEIEKNLLSEFFFLTFKKWLLENIHLKHVTLLIFLWHRVALQKGMLSLLGKLRPGTGNELGGNAQSHTAHGSRWGLGGGCEGL